MAKFEGEATPKSLTGRREDTGFASLQATFPPSSMSMEQPQYQSAPPMTYQAGPGPSTSLGLQGRPGASRMEPGGYAIPASGVLATGPPGMPMTSFQGNAPQGFPVQPGTGPGMYAPQLSIPAQEPVYMEAVNTQETTTTLENFPSVSALQPIPYAGADPPTPPQALSQLDLNATLDGQPPGTLTTVPFQSLPMQSQVRQDSRMYATLPPQSSSLPPQSTKIQSAGITTSGGLQDMQVDNRSQDFTSARALPSSTMVRSTVAPVSPRSRDPTPPRNNEPMQPLSTKSGNWVPETRTESPRSRTVTSMKSQSRLSEPPQSIKTIEDPFPSSSKVAKPFTEKDNGKSGDHKESEKENLISEIRERDAIIARLLGEVREKRATRLREVERLSDRMDHLEARLLSGHIDPH